MKLSLLSLLTLVPLFFTSCNTIAGIGKDISSIGGGVTNTAQKTSNAAHDKVTGVINQATGSNNY